MSIEISGGTIDKGIISGNAFDKVNLSMLLCKKKRKTR